MYMVQRHQMWWLLHDVPAKLQAAVGRKRYATSLGTDSKSEAKLRATAVELKWRAEIEDAVNPNRERDSEWWRRQHMAAGAAARVGNPSLLDLAVEAAHDVAGRIVGERADEMPTEAREQIERFMARATGAPKLDEHLDAYLKTLTRATGRRAPATAKTIAQKEANIKRAARQFEFVDDVTPKALQQWVDRLGADASWSTVKRLVNDLRLYWVYLQALEVTTADPFAKLVLSGRKPEERHAFTPAEIVRLLNAADGQVRDLIEVGRWTGARREEICALKVSEIDLGRNVFKVTAGKTKAAIRDVPVRAELRPVLARLISERTTGYLFEGLKEDANGDRGGDIGKDFGDLKTRLGFGKAHTFHSIRHSVVTMLEEAGVPESTIQSLVGHARRGVTLTTYSKRAPLNLLREAVEKLSYPSTPGALAA